MRCLAILSNIPFILEILLRLVANRSRLFKSTCQKLKCAIELQMIVITKGRHDTSRTTNKCIILQRVIPSYRVAVFRYITCSNELDMSLLIGDSIKQSKAKNADDLSASSMFVYLLILYLSLVEYLLYIKG